MTKVRLWFVVPGFVIVVTLAAQMVGLIGTSAVQSELSQPDGAYHDFGEVAEGRPVTHDFRIRNDTDRAVRLLGVQPSCACSNAELSDKLLEPGEEATLTIEYVGRSVRQRDEVRVIVHTDSEATPVLHFGMGGHVLLDTFWYPDSISVTDPFPTSKSVNFVSHAPDWSVSAIKASHEFMEIEVVDGEDGKKRLDVSFDKSTPAGAHTGRVSFQWTDGERIKPIVIPVHVYRRE